MIVWVAMSLSKYDGGRGFLAVGETKEAAFAAAIRHHEEMNLLGGLWFREAAELAGRPYLFPPGWQPPLYTAPAGPDHWYDVASFEVRGE